MSVRVALAVRRGSGVIAKRCISSLARGNISGPLTEQSPSVDDECEEYARSLMHGGVVRPILTRKLQQNITQATPTLEDLWRLLRADFASFDESAAVACLERAAELGFKLPSHVSSDRARGFLQADFDLPEGVPALLAALEERLKGGRLHSASVVRLVTVCAATRLTRPHLIQGLASEATRLGHRWSAVEAAASAKSFAVLRSWLAVEHIVSGAASRAVGFDSESLAQLAWAAAFARCVASSGIKAILDEASCRGSKLRPNSLASLIWAVGALRHRQEPFASTLLPFISHRVRHLSPRGVSNALCGISALLPRTGHGGWLEGDALSQLAVQALRIVAEFTPWQLAAMARGSVRIAAAGMRCEDCGQLVSAIVEESLRKLDVLEPSHIVAVLWAMARHKYRDPHPPSVIAMALTGHVHELLAAEVGSVLWSMASLRLRDDGLLVALTTQLEALIIAQHPLGCQRGIFDGFDAEQPDSGALSPPRGGVFPFRVLSSLVWTYAVLRASNAAMPLSEGLVEAAAQAVHTGTPQDLANLAWGAVLLGQPKTPLLGTIAREIQLRGGLSAQECANAAWAFATARVGSRDLFDRLSRDFLVSVTRLVPGEPYGRDWVGLIDALHRAGSETIASAELISAFERAIYEPVDKYLRAVLSPSKHKGDVLRGLERFASELDLGHIGATHTGRWLRCAKLSHELGAIPGDDLTRGEGAMPTFSRQNIAAEGWWKKAQDDSASRFLSKSIDGAAQPPQQRDVLAWVSCDISIKLVDLEDNVKETGRLVEFDPTMAVELGQTQAKELVPLLIGHSRAGHAERIALASVLSRVRTAEQQLRRRLFLRHPIESNEAKFAMESSLAAFVSGQVRLYASHTPCLSCLAVMAQFVRALPHVSLSVAFRDARLEAAAAPPKFSAAADPGFDQI